MRASVVVGRAVVGGVVLSAVLGIALLGGCSSSGGASSGQVANGMAQRVHGAALAPAAPAASATSAPSAGSAYSADGTARTAALIESQALIRIANLRVAITAGKVGEQADRAEDLATSAGGQVFSDDRSTGKDATASLTLKVPPEALTSVLTQLAALGTERARSLSTEDVTQQTADVASRVRSAQDSIARLRALYDHATKVGDVIAIESELATRESDLESLEAQQRTLAEQTSTATIHLELVTLVPTPPPPAKHHPTHHGIGGALANGWHGFTAAAAWIARAAATALPFLVVVLLLGGAGLVLWRRRPRPVPAPAPDPS